MPGVDESIVTINSKWEALDICPPCCPLDFFLWPQCNSLARKMYRQYSYTERCIVSTAI